MLLSVIGPVVESLREAFFMFWETLWALVLGFALSGAVQAFVSRGTMERLLGNRKPATLARATFLGMVSSSCSYAASAMAKSLFQKGADFSAAMVFMIASTNLVIELGLVLALLIGWQFTVSEFVGGAIMICLFAVVSHFALPERILSRVRDNFTNAAHQSGGTKYQQYGPATLTGWRNAAGFALADLNMLKRELLIGYLAAGFLSVLVPTAFWRDVFISGNGFWTSLENAIVGPFIAVISFVCSIGNVPLAAALWKGGITFGGVVAFIFADLITFPLLLIYRKFYGTAVTLRLLAAFWLVMSAAGLLTEYLFRAFSLVPTTRPSQLAPEQFAWNYTSFLNIAALATLASLLVLRERKRPSDNQTGFATDPTCGMQVEIASAPASAISGARSFYFCSDGCRDKWCHSQVTAKVDPLPNKTGS
jgi:uncharacterized membrane protein YraQ (UPF0718 family)/YHS domain-containing protein